MSRPIMAATLVTVLALTGCAESRETRAIEECQSAATAEGVTRMSGFSTANEKQLSSDWVINVAGKGERDGKDVIVTCLVSQNSDGDWNAIPVIG